MTTATANTDKGQKVNETITADEKRDLLSCEAKIRNGQKAFYKIGEALTIIAQGRLYRSTHSTMAKYASEKWDMTTARVSQYQASYRIHALLTLNGFKVLPVSESQCRPLVRIPADDNMDSKIVKAWKICVDSKEKITAKLVNDAVDAVLGIERKQDTQSDAGADTGANAGTGANADGPSASAEHRAELRALKAKIAYLESALEAEKRAHARTAKSGGIPTSNMAKRLYKAGFRALAKEMHPDHGGTAKGMAELNSLKDTLLG